MSKKFATLKDVSGGKGNDSGKESDGEDQPFYVGGSEHSGQQVMGPRGNRDGNNVTDRLFEAARNAGAEVEPSEESSASVRVNRFTGSGYRLGDNVGGSERVDASGAEQAEPTTVAVTMTAYENGFTINDGPLRSFDDPSNASFLSDIARGRIPGELSLAHPGMFIDLKMQRKAGEYEAPTVPKVVLFGGSGSRLGAVVPEVVTGNIPVAPPSKEEAAKLAADAQSSITIDSSIPITQVQIRLPDGNRLVVKLNTTATVADLRSFIAAASPTLAYSPFELRTSYPNAPIENETATLTDASLLNSVVIVKTI